MSDNFSYLIDSIKTVKAFWTILSLGFPTLSGLSSLLAALGICNLLVGEKLKLPVFIFEAIFSNHFWFIPSSVSSIIPLDFVIGLFSISR